MNRIDHPEDAAGRHDQAYFARLRDLAGQAGSAHVWHGYLLAAGRPEVHFGALCPAALSLRLSEDCYTDATEELGGVAWAIHEGRLPRPSGAMFHCPDCLRENERVVREMSQAQALCEEFDFGLAVSTLYWGERTEIDRIQRELTRMNGPREPDLRTI